MRQKNCPCLLWKIISSKNYFPCLLFAAGTNLLGESWKNGQNTPIFPWKSGKIYVLLAWKSGKL